MADRLEVRLEGDEGQVGARALAEVLTKTLDLLREAEPRELATHPRWRLEHLGLGSAVATIYAPDAQGVVDVLTTGLDVLRDRATLPPGWTQSMLRMVRDIGLLLGSDGTQGVQMRDVGESTTHVIDAIVTAHAELAMEVVDRSWGSIAGVVGRWNGTRHEIGVRPSDDGPPVRVRYSSSLERRILSEALQARGEFWGEVERNSEGQVVSMTLLDFEVLPAAESVPVTAIAGIMADDPEYPTTVREWLELNRGADG